MWPWLDQLASRCPWAGRWQCPPRLDCLLSWSRSVVRGSCVWTFALFHSCSSRAFWSCWWSLAVASVAKGQHICCLFTLVPRFADQLPRHKLKLLTQLPRLSVIYLLCLLFCCCPARVEPRVLEGKCSAPEPHPSSFIIDSWTFFPFPFQFKIYFGL